MPTTAYCNPDPEQPEVNPCITEPAGVIAVAFIQEAAIASASTVDIENSAWWAARLAADTAYAIKYTKGSYDGPAWEVDEEGYGLASEEIKGAKHSLKYTHKGIHIGTSGARTNIEFYNAIALQAGTYRVVWVDSGLKLWVSHTPVTVKPQATNPQSKKENNFWNVEVSWSHTGNPQTYDAPANLYS